MPCLLIYMLQRAKIKNDAANIVVAIMFSNSDSAVTSIVIRLVICSANSCFAFIVLCIYLLNFQYMRLLLSFFIINVASSMRLFLRNNITLPISS